MAASISETSICQVSTTRRVVLHQGGLYPEVQLVRPEGDEVGVFLAFIDQGQTQPLIELPLGGYVSNVEHGRQTSKQGC